MRYMLDTNTCIYLIKHHPPEVKQRLGTLSVGEVAVSSVVTAELWYGIAQSTKKKHNEAALEDFLKYVIVLDWPLKAAPEYGRIRAHLKKKGTPIGAMDLLIAAHAMVLDAVLVTDNISEFGRGAEAQGRELGESVRRAVYPLCLRLTWTAVSHSRPS